jgi:hypothetical protein
MSTRRRLVTILTAASIVISPTAMVHAATLPQPRAATQASEELLDLADQESCMKNPQHVMCGIFLADFPKIAERIKATETTLWADPDVQKALRSNSSSQQPHAPNLSTITKAVKAGIKDLPKKIGWDDRISMLVGVAEQVAEQVPEKPGAGEIVLEATKIIPVLGDVVSFVDGMRKGDGEEALIGSLGLIAIAAGGPVGLAIGGAIIIYSIGKLLWGFFRQKEADRDWASEPAGTAQELFQSGATIEWEKFANNAAVALGPNFGSVTETLLLDSRSTQWNNGQPASYHIRRWSVGKYYDIRPFHFTLPTGNSPITGISLALWQDGKQFAGKCGTDNMPETPFRKPGGGRAVTRSVLCAPTNDDVTITKDHPARVQITFQSRNTGYCGKPGCVLARTKFVLDLRPYNANNDVHIDVPFTISA